MNVPFLDLKQQYQGIRAEVEPEVLKLLAECSYIGGSYVANFEKEMSDYKCKTCDRLLQRHGGPCAGASSV